MPFPRAFFRRIRSLRVVPLDRRRAAPVVLSGLFVLLLQACASGGSYVPSPDRVPALEERVESSPDDLTAMARLGAAYHAGGRLAEAESLLLRVREADPGHARAAFFLGLVYEDQERPGEAIDLYRRTLELGAPGGLEDRIRSRIPLLRRQELRMAVRETLAREAELADTRPEPRTVAVFPFRFTGESESLEPLGRALAAMLSTDLSQTDRLSVLERVRVQALIDEMALATSGLVDPATAVRSGRLLGAGRIVQGRLGGTREALRIEAALVRAGADEGEMATLTGEDEASGLFRMEKDLAFRIYETMGISLTPAERERVNQSFTENLQALLAYGRGLEALDAGRYGEAGQHFREAHGLDPGFSEAEGGAREADELSSADETSTGELAEAGAEAATELDIARQVEDLVREAGLRDPAQEVLGAEGVGRAGTLIELILKRPGGGSP